MSGDAGKVPELQQFFQKAHGHIHTRGKADRVTSLLIPVGMAAVGATILVRGLYHMYTGTGKME